MKAEAPPGPVTLCIQGVDETTPLPGYQTVGAAGLDLTARGFSAPERLDERAATFELAPGRRVMAWTGLRMAVPEGYVGLVCPRSGLALRHGVTLLNAPGVIDADYRGEVGVVLVNLGHEAFACVAGERVAQLVVTPVATATVRRVESLPSTARGEGGFGSTGR